MIFPNIDWADFAHSVGYTDQAQFAHDFAKMTPENQWELVAMYMQSLPAARQEELKEEYYEDWGRYNRERNAHPYP